MYNRGDVVLCTWGYNEVLRRPYEFLFEFGYVGQTGDLIVFKRGESGMQDAMAFPPSQVKLATPNDRDQRFFYR